MIHIYRCQAINTQVFYKIRGKTNTSTAAFGSASLSKRMPTTETARARIATDRAVEPD